MRLKITTPFLLALPLLLGVLPGCRVMTLACRTIGVCSAGEQHLGPVMATDFVIVVKVESQAEPAADYIVTLRRDGTGEYKVTRRAPTRSETSGKLSVLEGKLQQIWDAVAAAEYPTLPDRFPEEGDGPNKAAGIQSFNVNANEFPKEVQLVYATDERLTKIRRLVESTLPEKVFSQVSQARTDTTSSLQVVGDTLTKRFYAPESPALKEVPANRRQAFPTYFAALDFGYQPGIDWRAPEVVQDR